MKKIFSWVLLFSIIASTSFASGCSQNGTSTSASDVASSTSQAADASSDNTLVVYTPNSEGLVNSIIPGFEKKYGIKVSTITAGSGELIKRLLSEANNPQADIDFGGVNYSIYKQNPTLFEKYVSPEDKNLPEEFQNTTGYYTNYTLNGSCLLVNTDLIGNIKVESYEDLLNPELKGKIATTDPATSSSAFAQLTNILLAKGGYESDEAWDYVGKLIKQFDGKVLSGSSAVYKGVADGEYTVGLTYEDPCAALVQSGAHVKIVYPSEGTVYLPSAAAIIKGCKHLENAKKFIDYLLSDEAQKVMGEKLTNRPIKASVECKTLTPISEIKTITEDISYVAEHKTDITTRYTDLFASLQ
jgi:iron(III) transport system substrate-binding protein